MSLKSDIMSNIRAFLISALILMALFFVCHFILAGVIFPRSIQEELNNPKQVTKITPKGFLIADGSLIKVKYILELPKESEVLNKAIEHGIEIDDKGHIFGLIKVWHWCGNDPVRYHIARVDLSSLILVAGGKPNTELPKKLLYWNFSTDTEIQYSEHGLKINDLYLIRQISEHLKLITEKAHSM